MSVSRLHTQTRLGLFRVPIVRPCSINGGPPSEIDTLLIGIQLNQELEPSLLQKFTLIFQKSFLPTPKNHLGCDIIVRLLSLCQIEFSLRPLSLFWFSSNCLDLVSVPLAGKTHCQLCPQTKLYFWISFSLFLGCIFLINYIKFFITCHQHH